MIVHHAAQISVPLSVRDPLTDAEVNIKGTLRLLELSRMHGVKRFVFASTGGAIYGEASVVPTPEDYVPQPSSPYAISKLSCEHYIRFYEKQHNLVHVIVRYSNVYGPRQIPHGEAGVVAIFLPVPGVEWPQIRDVALVARDVLADFGLTGWPKTSGSRGMHIYAHARWCWESRGRDPAAGWRGRSSGGRPAATSKWWKEERHGVFVDYNQNAKDRTVASAYSLRPVPDVRVSTPLTWAEVPSCDPAQYTIGTVPARFARIGDPWAEMDEAAGSLDGLLELAARDEAAGLPDAPWPPHYEKQTGEGPRVQPSKRRSVGSGGRPPETPRDRGTHPPGPPLPADGAAPCR